MDKVFKTDKRVGGLINKYKYENFEVVAEKETNNKVKDLPKESSLSMKLAWLIQHGVKV